MPLGALLASLTLKRKKAASLVAVTRELLQSAPAIIEQSLRVLLGEDLGLMIDGIFLGDTAVSPAQPAGILNGLTPLSPTAGGGINALLTDIKALLNAISPAIRPVLIANSTQAASIGILAPSSRLPVISAPHLTAGTVIAFDSAAFVSSIGAIDFSVSSNAALHTDAVPSQIGVAGSPNVVAAPTAATTALRSILECDWMLRRIRAVAVVTGVTW